MKYYVVCDTYKTDPPAIHGGSKSPVYVTEIQDWDSLPHMTKEEAETTVKECIYNSPIDSYKALCEADLKRLVIWWKIK